MFHLTYLCTLYACAGITTHYRHTCHSTKQCLLHSPQRATVHVRT